MSPRLLKPIIVTTLCSGALFAANNAAAENPALAAATAQAEAYKSAFDKGDAAALAGLFTEDAQYSVDSGETVSGRAAIKERTADYFKTAGGATIDIEIGSARLLTPDVFVEKGIAIVTGDGASRTTRYTATQVKKGDKWLIAELHEAAEASDPAAEALTSLEWLIGKWEVAKEGIDAKMEAIWALDGRYITRTTTVEQDDGSKFVAVELIGYDPTQGQIRSWLFDNEGGYGSGTWRRDGNKWLIRSRATGPNGDLSSSQHILTVIDEKTWGLSTINRVINGEVLPNRDLIKIVRVPEEK